MGFVPARPVPLTTVRTLLIWMMLAGFLPGLAVVGFFVLRQYQDGRAQLAIHTVQTARALVQAVDVQLAQGEMLALTLASSGSLVRRDFAAFQQRALRLIGEMPFVQSVHIYQSNGVPLVNTRLPWGQVLPRRINLAQIHSVFESSRPAAPELIVSPLTRLPVVSIAVPVFAGDKVEYVLAVGISPDVFSGILARQNLPPNWVTGVVDSSGTVVARTHAPETFVGQKAAPAILQQLALAPEGSIEASTLEGIASVVPYSRSARSGWSVAIGIPRDALEAQLRQSLLVLSGGAMLVLGLSLGSVWFFGRRFTATAVALRALAQALGNGTRARAPQLQLREAQEVAQSMVTASHALSDRADALAESHAALVAREAELADAQRIAKIGSWFWDAQTGQSWNSQEMCRIFGRSEIPPFAQQDGLLFSHEAWQLLRDARSAMAHSGLAYNLELPALHADGTTIQVNSRAEVIRNAAGEMTGARGMVQDITVRTRQTRELNTLRAEMQTMMEWQVARHTVAALAHEINQPLASLAVLCEAASRMLVIDGLSAQAAGEQPKRLGQTLQSMGSETERAGIVIRQLMQSVQQPDVTLQPTVLYELLSDAIRMVQGEGGFDCQIHLSCPGQLKPLHVNQLQITKVLLNLIGNAAQAMQAARIAHGDIWIGASLVQDGAMLDVSVRDSGPGIAANRASEVFQAFVSTRPDGLGMGLAISRALVEAHGGKLWLEAGTGPGATFHFTLPTSTRL